MIAAFRDLVATTEERPLCDDLQRLTENQGEDANELYASQWSEYDECVQRKPMPAKNRGR